MSSNIAASNLIKRDFKKGKIEMLTKYNPIGVVDGAERMSATLDKFSLEAKQKSIQRAAS